MSYQEGSADITRVSNAKLGAHHNAELCKRIVVCCATIRQMITSNYLFILDYLGQCHLQCKKDRILFNDIWWCDCFLIVHFFPLWIHKKMMFSWTIELELFPYFRFYPIRRLLFLLMGDDGLRAIQYHAKQMEWSIDIQFSLLITQIKRHFLH